ncbi:hybrid sensor histidine kinase/response regulator transcription factor [Flavivirga eckloniae]|uniref:histidine kinase n=1 Tax=Flavivirga eckloniae TaxID=1803846 RepID=A0A2K9PN97_9FLAO|nr:hybrid sensor histidine kinase/response regulator transcription factor [Flavivirga eckloniae]AUP78529.1 hypothetical protein C1H87_07320 [Flavivirga eckloniae]
MKPLKLFLLFFIIFLSQRGNCQDNFSIDGDLKFKNYTIFDGLPSISIPCITQDSKGFMWFGTRNGISRFDGFDFTNFFHDSEDDMSLSHNQIQSVFTDSKGELWIGTKKGLNRYIEGVGFEKYYSDDSDFSSLAGNVVLSICEDKDHVLWIGTDNGLHKYNRELKNFKRYVHNDRIENSLRGNFIKEIYADSKGILWMITDQGVEKYNTKENSFKYYPLGNNNVVNISGAIKEDSKGRIWVGDTEGLWHYNDAEDKFVSYFGFNNILENVSIRALWEDEEGNLLIGSYTGLYIDNIDKKTTHHIRHDKYDPYSISKNSIHAIFEDRIGNLWIGTWAGGVNYLDKSFDSFNHYSEPSGLSYPVVSAFVEDHNKNLWIGTEGGGLDYFNRSEGTFINFKHDENNKNSLSEDNVHDVIQDDEGNLWIATFGGGVNYFNPNKSPAKFEHYKNNVSDSLSIGSNYVFTLLEDSNQNIWMGTYTGINMFDPKLKQFVRFPEKKEGYVWITTIFENYKKEILVGSSNGLGLVDIEKREILYDHFNKINASINENVLCIYQDNKSNYWLGTEGEGLVYVENDLSTIIKYRKNEGLPSDVVYGILPDNYGNLWLSTHGGLSKFNMDLKTFDNYDIHDGLQSNEFNYDAYAISSDGELIFGGVNGFNIFNPQEIKKNNNPPPVILTEFKIDEKTVKIGDENAPLTKPLSQTQEIILSYDQSLFSFEFIGFNYSQPEKNEYAYMLEGFNDDWLHIGNRRQVTFTNIESGDYVFKVKASNNSHTWNEAGTSIKIKILPPPWSTWWAFLLYFILCVFIGYLLWRYARLRINDRNALQNEIKEREKDEEIYELKLRFFTNISHELRTPLTLILGPLDNILQKKGDLIEGIKEEISLVRSNAQKLLRHVNNIMDFRKDEIGQLKLRAAKGDIVKFCNETFISFRQLAESRGITYNFSNKTELDHVYFDRDKMEIVLYNLLSNAFKFTPDGGEISFTISQISPKNDDIDRVCLSIKDNGYGMEPKHTNLIFERFFQIETSQNFSNGSGIGLTLTKRLVELHHGNIKVESELGMGSLFTVELPLGKKHLNSNEIFKAFKHGEDVANYSERKWKKPDVINKPDKEVTNKNLPLLLIIEDNLDVRKFIVSCFSEEYNIQEASNGGIGYELATELIPDLIISDVMMPEMDGISLCSKLKKDINTCHIPIILLTARTSLIFKKDGLQTGADDYINKPFKPSILRLKVKNLMESRKKLHEYFIRNYRINPKEVVLNSKDDEFLEKAINCIERHLSNSDFNVSTFIEEIGMSRSVLFRKIKSLTGQSTTEFIRVIRIKRAAQLLVQNQMSISEIAYEVGFNDLKYFRTCFRRQFKCSPSEYITNNSNA